VTVTNLTGHKLISGYPEGRRMWLQLEWKNGSGETIHQDGEYGPLDNGGVPVTVTDLHGVDWNVESILDPSSTKIYKAKPGISQDWAAALISLGWPADMPVEYDRLTNATTVTLQDVADLPVGEAHESFHFVLNNAVVKDNRIPPYGFDHDIAMERNALPFPEDQYGYPGTAPKYNHFDVVSFDVPPGAESVEVHLLYQSTTWEYIQFLWQRGLANSDPFLGDEGVNLLDAWLNTGMSAPFEMTEVIVPVSGASFNAPGHVSLDPAPLMTIDSFDPGTGEMALTYSPACDAEDHSIHYGPLFSVSSYAYADAQCGFGISGSALFTPDPAVGDSLFFVVVGNNPDFEGSYGVDKLGGERPPNTTAAGACLKTQSLATVCE
jgi:hypothetical protein